jgi:prepilin-type N-terminal cleavage/methylation domain-containing protein
MKQRLKKGFTLAEVLIVLGIIGIIAEITIPTLMKNTQKTETEVKLKETYSIISQAIRLSEIDNGEYSGWDYTTNGFINAGTKAFLNTYIKPYLKNLTFCSDGIVNAVCGFIVSGAGTNLMLNNGVGFSVVLSSDNRFYMIIDLNNAKKPNVMGKDVFYFTLDSTNGFVPYGYTKGMTRDQIIDNGSEKCTTANKYMCTALIMIDGWQIKDDYPW